MVLKAPLATAAMSITMFIASYVTAGKFSLESLVAYWQPALTSDPIALLCAAAIEAAAAFAIGYVVAAAAGLAIMWNDMTDDGQRAEIRKWEAAERAQEREIRDLMAIRRRAEQSHLPRNLIPEDVDGYHVISMSVQPYILDDNDNRVAIDPIVKVSRYYSAHDLLDNDGTVSDAFDPRRTRLEEYALSGLPDGELLAAFVHASRDISVSVSLGTFTGFQDYELEASRAVAAEVKRRGLA